MVRSLPLPILALVSLCLLLPGCEANTSSDSAFTSSDSAGIVIVESSAPMLGPDAWTISDGPVLQIGAVEGEEAYLLADVGGAYGSFGRTFRLADGRLVICSDLDRTVRFYDSQGRFQDRVGGEGDGPGEFRSIWACMPSGAGVLAIGYPGKLVTFDPGGNLLETRRITTVAGERTDVFGILSDGSGVVLASTSPRPEGESGVFTRTRDVYLVSPDSAPAAFLFSMRANRTASDGQTSRSQAFGPHGQLYAFGEAFMYGWPETYEIFRFDQTGRLEQTIRRRWNPPPVTEEDRSWWRGFVVNIGRDFRGNDSPSLRQAFQRQVDAMVYPDHHPAFDRILVDRLGWLWIRWPHPRYDSAYQQFAVRFPYRRTWDVFDPRGRWVTTLDLPEGFEVHDIGEDYVLGVWKDEFNVEYVRMYSLDRGSLP